VTAIKQFDNIGISAFSSFFELLIDNKLHKYQLSWVHEAVF
jgi:hypothetical protein